VGSKDNEALVVSHLLFGDDTLIFLWCEFRTNLTFTVSDLRINLGKSEIVPIREVEDVKNLAYLLGSRVSSLLMKYLEFVVECFI
jgi:hypothetical protein